MAKSIRDYREMLSPEDIKRILKEHGVSVNTVDLGVRDHKFGARRTVKCYG